VDLVGDGGGMECGLFTFQEVEGDQAMCHVITESPTILNVVFVVLFLQETLDHLEFSWTFHDSLERTNNGMDKKFPPLLFLQLARMDGLVCLVRF